MEKIEFQLSFLKYNNLVFWHLNELSLLVLM